MTSERTLSIMLEPRREPRVVMDVLAKRLPDLRRTEADAAQLAGFRLEVVENPYANARAAYAEDDGHFYFALRLVATPLAPQRGEVRGLLQVLRDALTRDGMTCVVCDEDEQVLRSA